MKKGSEAGRLAGMLRAGMVFSLVALGVGLLAGGGQSDDPVRTVDAGWGGESLNVLQDGLRKVSPIALANACGMGASSCFKCHNGKRAGKPDMDEAKSPWHVQHSKVNNSCVGCHKGNPRMMKEQLAHAGLLKSPRSGAECAACHKADQAKVEAAYKSVTGGSK